MLKKNTTDRIYRLQIFDNLIVDEKYGMPIVKKYNGEQPIKLQAFNKAVAQKQYENTVHFYLNDKEFLRILTYPQKYLEILKHFKSVISPLIFLNTLICLHPCASIIVF